MVSRVAVRLAVRGTERWQGLLLLTVLLVHLGVMASPMHGAAVVTGGGHHGGAGVSPPASAEASGAAGTSYGTHASRHGVPRAARQLGPAADRLVEHDVRLETTDCAIAPAPARRVSSLLPPVAGQLRAGFLRPAAHARSHCPERPALRPPGASAQAALQVFQT